MVPDLSGIVSHTENTPSSSFTNYPWIDQSYISHTPIYFFCPRFFLKKAQTSQQFVGSIMLISRSQFSYYKFRQVHLWFFVVVAFYFHFVLFFSKNVSLYILSGTRNLCSLLRFCCLAKWWKITCVFSDLPPLLPFPTFIPTLSFLCFHHSCLTLTGFYLKFFAPWKSLLWKGV